MIRDLRFALRALARTPGFAIAVTLSLALAIGANTAVFAWLDAMVLRPFPVVRDADRLVALDTRAPNGASWSLSYPTLKDWERGSTTLEGIAGYSMAQVNLRADGESDRAWALMTTGTYFDLLGVPALHGRTFHRDEEDAAAPVAVLGHSFWERRFGGDPSVVGRDILLNGNGFTIIGIAPPRFGGTYVGLGMDLYVPVTVQPLLTPLTTLRERGSMWLDAVARMAPGVTLEQAQADLSRVALQVAADHGREGEGAIVKRVRDEGAGQVMGPVLFALLGVTLLVLLIACANVANLLLARAGARRKEIGVRLAMGAPRGRLVRQLLTESALLAVAGGVAGLVVAHLGRNALLAFIPPAPFPIDLVVRLDGRVLGFAALLTAVTTLVFGLVPALRASRPDLAPVLKDEVGGRGVSRSLLRSGLVVAQVSMSLVALVCAGLFLRALQRAGETDHGIVQPERVLVVTTDLHLAGFDRATGSEALAQAVERLEALPGVERVAFASWLPLGFAGSSSQGIRVEGYAPEPDENMSILTFSVTTGYLAALGMPIVRGRDFGAEDRVGAQPVMVVNETFARHFFGGGEALGRRVVHGGDSTVIVGVVRDGKYQQLNEAARPVLWRPIPQVYRARLELIARTAGPPGGYAGAVRNELLALHPDFPVLDSRTMADQISPATIGQRIGAQMLGLFGGLALLLSGLGIYGVMAYTVSLRTREIGVRIALGAAGRSVVRLIVRQGARLTLLGLAIGGGLAFGAGRLLQSQLFGVPAGDPVTYLAIGGILLGVALIASAVPAWRAARIDPVRALRTE